MNGIMKFSLVYYCCTLIVKVVAGLKRMKKQKAMGLSWLVAEMI